MNSKHARAALSNPCLRSATQQCTSAGRKVNATKTGHLLSLQTLDHGCVLRTAQVVCWRKPSAGTDWLLVCSDAGGSPARKAPFLARRMVPLAPLATSATPALPLMNVPIACNCIQGISWQHAFSSCPITVKQKSRGTHRLCSAVMSGGKWDESSALRA
jgi:hypothetical protein